MSEQTQKLVDELRKAQQCLYLEVADSIADDVKRMGETVISALEAAERENERYRKALEFYADRDKWCEFLAESDMCFGRITVRKGQPFMAFCDGDDHPWTTAREIVYPV